MSKQTTNPVLFVRTLKRHCSRGFVVFSLILFLLPLLTYTRAYLPASLTRLGLGTQTAYAATSDNLNFQARLETSAGAIAADGYYNLEFKLYDASTGGTLLWTETYYDSNGVTAGNDNRVRVANGYVTVNLGSQTAFPGTMPWDQQLYLTMNVGGTTQTATPTWDGEMNPRLKLTAVPYAFNAKTASELTKSNGGFLSTLSIQAPTGGNQIFQIPDQGAGGTYTLLTGAAANGSYIQNQNGTDQSANFRIDGSGRAGSFSANTTVTVGSASTQGTMVLHAGNGFTTTLLAGASAANRTITFPVGAGSNGDCVLTDGAGQLSFGSCPGAGGSGVTTVGAIDSQTKSANGAVISGTTIYMQTAGISEPGLVGTAGQTFAGNKTFQDGITLATANAAQDRILIAAANLGSNPFDGTITNADLTAARTWTLPDASGTIAVSASGNIALSAAGNITFTGQLPLAGGGTGANLTASNGGIVYTNASQMQVLAGTATAGQCLVSGSSAAPSWGDCNASGSGNYIQNQYASVQQGNFNIQSANLGQVAAKIQGAVGQANDVLQVADSSGTDLFYVSNGTGVGVHTVTNDIQGFLVQSSSNNAIFTVDTANSQIIIASGTTDPSANLIGGAMYYNTSTNRFRCYLTGTGWVDCTPSGSGYANTSLSNLASTNINAALNTTAGNLTLQTTTSGNINIAPVGTINLQSNTSIAANKTLTAQGSATFQNATDSTTAFQVNNQAGTNLLGVDTTNGALNLGQNSIRVGYQTVGGNPNNGSQNGMAAMKITPSASGTIKTVTFWVNGTDSAPNNKIQVALYADGAACGTLSSCPGALIASTGDLAALWNRWNTASLTATVTGGTSYWLAVNNNSTSSALNDGSYDTGTGGSYIFKAQAYGTWPGTYPTSGASTNNNVSLSMYANIVTASSGYAVAVDGSGRTVINNDVTLVNSSPDAFAIQQTAGDPVFKVDTAMKRVGINTNNPVASLDLNISQAWFAGLQVTGASAQSANLLQLADNAGLINASFSATGNQLTLGRVASSGTVTQGKIILADGTTDNFGLTLQSGTLTANRTITLPNSTVATDTVCLQSLGNCLAAGGAANQQLSNLSGTVAVNMGIVPGSSYNNTIDLGSSSYAWRTGYFGTSVIAPLLQTASTSTASTNSASISITSGNATGSTSNSGNVSIDVGTATGTKGTINIGTANSPTINIATNNVAHAIHIGDGGTSTAQSVTIGSTSSTSQLTLQTGDNPMVFNKNGTYATAYEFNVGGTPVATIDTFGYAIFHSLSPSSSIFKVTDDTNTTLFNINSSTGTTYANYLQGAYGLEAPHLTLGSGIGDGTTTPYTTPTAATVSTRINVTNSTLGAYDQVIALGTGSASDYRARVISVFDQRSGNHQPSIAVFDPTENDLVGFSWEGSSTNATVKTIASGSTISLTPAQHTVLRAFDTYNVRIGKTTNENPADPNATLSVQDDVAPASVVTNGTNAKRILNVLGQTGGATTGTSGQTAGTGADVLLQGGQGGNASTGSTNGAGGNITLSAGAAGSGTGTAGVAGSVVIKNQANSTAAFQIQNTSSTALFTADTSGMVIKIAGTTTTFSILQIDNAHFKSTQTTAPTIGTPSTCGTSPTAAMGTNATDAAGAFRVTAGTGSPGTCSVTVTFDKGYGAAPKSIMIAPENKDGGTAGTAAAKQVYISGSGTTTFTVTFGVAPAASEVNWYYYWVVE